MTAGTVGGRYSGMKETVVADGDTAAMHGNKGRRRTATGGRGDGMTDR